MKPSVLIRLVLPVLIIGFTNCLLSQDIIEEETPCDPLLLDLEKGTINDITGFATMDEVKTNFPCFTGETEEGSEFNCGGGVFFLNHDVYYYTWKDYITVRDEFWGECTPPVVGQEASAANEHLGEPTESFVYTDEFFGEETTYMQYSKDWGTLVVLVKDKKVIAIELHHGKKIGDIEFCF